MTDDAFTELLGKRRGPIARAGFEDVASAAGAAGTVSRIQRQRRLAVFRSSSPVIALSGTRV